MKKTIFLFAVLNIFFLSNSFSQQSIDIEFGQVDASAKSKDVTLTATNITEGIVLVINGIPDLTTKNQLKLKNNAGSEISMQGGGDATQATYNLTSANLIAITDAVTADFQLSKTAGNIGKIIFKKQAVETVAARGGETTNDLSNHYQQAFKTKHGKDFTAGKIIFDEKLNQARERKIIHIFLDDDGTFYKSSLPTTAREDNIYIFHVFYKKGKKSPALEYEGSFDPKFEVEGGTETSSVAVPNAVGEKEVIEIDEKTFGAIGPFTGAFTVKITGSSKILINKTVKVAKLHHVTVNAGFYASFLRSPQNIETYVKPNGDTTLVADDPTSRGFINVMLTFYPFPRNIYFPSGDWRERIAFNVGTTISKNLSENIFGGISYDVSRGLALGAGAHYGRRSYVIDQPGFKFGEDKFSGSLTARVKKRWDIGFYAGVTIDMRLLGFLFNQTPASASQ